MSSRPWREAGARLRSRAAVRPSASEDGVIVSFTSGSSDSLLVCYDGSDGSRQAIDVAGRLFGRRRAIVLTVWQPSMSALASFNPLGELVALAGGLFRDIDEIAARQAGERAEEGAALAASAGLDAEPRAARGLAHGVWAACSRR